MLPASLCAGGDLGVVGIPAGCWVALCVGPPGSQLPSKVSVAAGGAIPQGLPRKRHFGRGSSPCAPSIHSPAPLRCPILPFIPAHSRRARAEDAPQRAAASPPGIPRGCGHLPVRGSQPLRHRCGEDQADRAR